MGKKIKSYPEIQQTGYLSIEQDLHQGGKKCVFGVQVAEDGRVWICVDGISLLRFRPTGEYDLLDKGEENEEAKKEATS